MSIFYFEFKITIFSKTILNFHFNGFCNPFSISNTFFLQKINRDIKYKLRYNAIHIISLYLSCKATLFPERSHCYYVICRYYFYDIPSV